MYKKGARAERELQRLLESRGFAVVRSAGSGKSVSPDLLAIRRGMAVGFECKAVDKEVLYLRSEQVEKLGEWKEKAGVPVLIAWKRKGLWRFVPLSPRVSWSEAERSGIRLEDLERFF